MARSRFPLLLVLAVVAAAEAACLPSAAGAEYCCDSLSGLTTCEDFMFRGAPAALPACCAAYSAAFDADPFCLCYIANGVYGRSTGYDVNVTHALEIPVSCGLVTPPIELCDMQGLVLPPYEPSSAQPPAATPPQHPAAKPAVPQAPMPSSPPSFTSPPPMTSSPPSFASPPPMPPPTSHGARGAATGIGTVAAAVTVTLLALLS